MDEEYEAYDDTLAQILKHAGVDGKVTPAPDYETGVTESMLTDSTGHTIDHILNRFKHEVKRFQNGDEIDTELYHALFDYYNDHGEMPYGIAKARDGDPVNWISDKLAAKLGMDELGIDESSQDYQPEMTPASVAVPGPVSDVIVDESACNMTAEGEFCPEHGLEACGMYEGDYGLTLAPTAESREFDLTRLKQLALGK